MIAMRYFPGMTPEPSADLCAELLLHLARLGQSGATRLRLTPAQWTALRFFARANRFSRTPSAFSSFHATTRGTASQTVKSLVAAGLLERHRSESDGRCLRFELTEAGRTALEEDPLNALAGALSGLPAGRRSDLLASLRTLLDTLSDARGAEAFGTCGDCRHLEPCAGGGDGWVCRCAESSLLAGEFDKLCVDFTPRTEAPADLSGSGAACGQRS